MVLCACVISELIGDWSGVDVERATEFVREAQVRSTLFHPCTSSTCSLKQKPLVLSKSYEGGYAQRPGQESQGGTTYCSIVSLQLLQATRDRTRDNATTSWLLHRQIPVIVLPGLTDSKGAPVKSRIKGGGFQGRPGKKGDACYSYWCGGALQVHLSVAFPLQSSLD